MPEDIWNLHMLAIIPTHCKNNWHILDAKIYPCIVKALWMVRNWNDAMIRKRFDWGSMAMKVKAGTLPRVVCFYHENFSRLQRGLFGTTLTRPRLDGAPGLHGSWWSWRFKVEVGLVVLFGLGLDAGWVQDRKLHHIPSKAKHTPTYILMWSKINIHVSTHPQHAPHATFEALELESQYKYYICFAVHGCTPRVWAVGCM